MASSTRRVAPSTAQPHQERVATFAKAVRARRKTLRLTQITLSQLAGVGADFVYDVENGKTTLRLDKLLQLLEVLGLELVLDEGRQALRVAPTLAPPEPKATSNETDAPRAKPTARRRRS